MVAAVYCLLCMCSLSCSFDLAFVAEAVLLSNVVV